MKRFNQIILSAICLIACVDNLCCASELSSELALAAPQNIESAIRQAQARYDSGNIYGAWTLAEKIADKYPDNQEVRNLIATCISREAADYNSAVESLSVDMLNNYLVTYQDKARAADVNERIQDLPLWNTARTANTIAAYNDYLVKSTNKKYADAAQAAIGNLQIEQDWKTAKDSNTFAAYENFRKTHPHSKYDSEASNNMAKRLADKFTKNSKDEDKIKALGYATNEMTRDYVKNKFNASRPKTTNSYSSSSSSSSRYSSSSGSSSSYGSYGNYGGHSSSSYGNSQQSSGKGFNIGASILGEWDCSRGFNCGIGLTWRLWRYNSMFNAMIGLRYMYSVNTRSEYNTSYYDYHSYSVKDFANQLSIPITVNWNFIRTDTWGMYFGMGYEFGKTFSSNNALDQTNSLLIKWGVGGRHWDWSMYFKKSYPTTLYLDKYNVGFLGMDLTYYF